MTTNRYPFDHRIDDDLFEVILSYLPIEDKFKYESVSKRFQRFVFNKQNVLRIKFYQEIVDCLDLAKLITNFPMGSKLDVFKLSSILKKLQFITRIEINFRLENMSDVLNAITDNCNHLNAFQLFFNGVDSETLKRFCQKFGQQLKHISFPNSYDLDLSVSVNERFSKYLFECSPNLLSVSNININALNSVLIPKGLVKINKLLFLYVNDLDEIQRLPTENLKVLKNLSVCISLLTEENYEFVKILSKFKHLKQLKISFFGPINSDLLLESMETIAKKSLQLESFSFKCSFDSFLDQESNTDINLVFKSLEQFSRLKNLEFIDLGSEECISHLKPLNNCKNLLSLSLRANRGINDNIFEGIQSIVPQLRRLSVNSDLLTERSLESIATFKHLRQLQIIERHKVDITVEAVQKLKDDRPRLQVVTKYFCLDI